MATAHEQADLGDPGKNDRHYLKWGTDVVYEPPFAVMDWAFLGVRFDRVMTHTDHESLAFRVVSPRIGAELADGVEVFAQYSFYDYGDNVTFEFFDELEDKAKRSLNRDKDAVSPDDQVFKLQAQARW